MNKYELAVVLTTKIEDEERAASIEKIKEVLVALLLTLTNGARRDLLMKFRR